MMSNNSRVMNSMLNAPRNSLVSNSSTAKGFGSYTYIIIALTLIALSIGLLIYFYQDQLAEFWNSLTAPVPAPAPAPADASGAEQDSDDEDDKKEESTSILEKVLPGGKTQVFNISSNKFTYTDAEPLCKALGAELATYDQVKEAWSKGADWCNYGWVKGQMAVYPTSQNTYDKMQKGPADQRLSCGRPGVNGGYFDNPELRYGVNCYGPKPSQSKHDESLVTLATPISPDALEFDKKVSEYKSQADTIGVMPFNKTSWN